MKQKLSKYTFGYWWSRYWQYSDNEFRDLIDNISSLYESIDKMTLIGEDFKKKLKAQMKIIQ